MIGGSSTPGETVAAYSSPLCPGDTTGVGGQGDLATRQVVVLGGILQPGVAA